MITKEIHKYIFNNSNKVKLNSKDIVKGDIFICLAGKNNHGNLFIQDALDKGARFIISNKEFNSKNKEIIIVKNVLDFITSIAKKKRALYQNKVIGITGSIGKTTIKENLSFFLKSDFKVSVSIKSYNNYLGVIISLLNMDLESSFNIFEMGTNNFKEIGVLTKIIKPSQVIITNIYPTHLENLINTNNIAKEKSDIFNPIYNKNIELAILSNNNKDEEFIIKKAKRLNQFSILTFGKNKNSDIKIYELIKINKLYYKILVIFKDQNLSFIINKDQINKLNNILICICFFIFNKINLNIIFSKSKEIPLIEGRGLQKNLIINNKKILFVDESYNASPESMRIVVDYFDSIKLDNTQKKFLILGDMQELGIDNIVYHIELLKYIENKNLKNIILCGEFMQIALDKNLKNNFKLIIDKKILMNYLNKILNNNDIIVIKGSNSSMTNQVAKDLIKMEEH